jgi:aminoglycoside 3-N-acetyltransferase
MAAGRERDAFAPILHQFEVAQDGVLVIHSAIAALSRQGYRAEAMIESFLEYMSGGTVVMPTMTWRTVTPLQPFWDEIETRSETGIMSEIFRTKYASRRSIHPTHSVAVHGPAAEALVARHHLDDTPVSANSPYGMMHSHKSYVLMIGVGLESCTAIHLPEETIAPDVYLQPLNSSEIYYCKDRHGEVHHMRARRHCRLNRDFPQFGPPLATAGRLRYGEIDGCRYIIVGLQDLLGKVTTALQANKNGTLNQSRHAS